MADENPVIRELLDQLAHTHLHPQLRALGILDAERYTLGYGTTPVLRDGEPVTPEGAAEEIRRCPRCLSAEWVSVSLDGGYTRKAQCVPCGHVHAYLGPGWRQGA